LSLPWVSWPAGIAIGVFSNWLWEKWKRKRRGNEPYLDISYSSGLLYFEGQYPDEYPMSASAKELIKVALPGDVGETSVGSMVNNGIQAFGGALKRYRETDGTIQIPDITPEQIRSMERRSERMSEKLDAELAGITDPREKFLRIKKFWDKQKKKRRKDRRKKHTG